MTVRVVFTRRRTLGSLILRTFLWSAWSHCALISEWGDWIIEASPRGVRVRPLGAMQAEASKWEIIELPGDAAAAWAAADTQRGKPYDWGGVLGIAFRRRWHHRKRWFCSELIAWACAQAGRPLMRGETYRITPRDLYLPRW